MSPLVWAQLGLTLGHGFNLDLLQESHLSRTSGLTPKACSYGDGGEQEDETSCACAPDNTPLAKPDMCTIQSQVAGKYILPLIGGSVKT